MATGAWKDDCGPGGTRAREAQLLRRCAKVCKFTCKAMAFLFPSCHNGTFRRTSPLVCSASSPPAASSSAVRRALLLVDHGSRRNEANEMLDEVKDMVLGLKPDVSIVETAHMELAEPSIPQAIDRCVALGAEEIVVQPYFLSPGRHSTTDIPDLVDASAKKHPHVQMTVTEPLGIHSKIGEVVLERAGLHKD